MRSLTNNSLRLMERSMDFLWAKQAAHLDNISNAETPGYKVKTVTFEELLGSKLDSLAKRSRLKPDSLSAGQIRRVIEKSDWEVTEDSEVTRMDENGVNLMEQSLEAVRTAYQLQYTMQSISSHLTTLGKAING